VETSLLIRRQTYNNPHHSVASQLLTHPSSEELTSEDDGDSDDEKKPKAKKNKKRKHKRYERSSSDGSDLHAGID
jgi:hypothetical protein